MKPSPVLAMVGAVVLIDTMFPETITTELRRNRAEAFIAIAWLVVHVAKTDRRHP